MDEKKLLIRLCDNLEKELNRKKENQTHKVELQSKLKPEGYFTALMHTGTTKTLFENHKMAWFVEVWVDKKCIFRECALQHKNESFKEIESFLISKILNHVFMFGIMSSKNLIDECDK